MLRWRARLLAPPKKSGSSSPAPDTAAAAAVIDVPPRGVYVAWHPWLDAVNTSAIPLFKIGASLNLGRRLLDGGYTLCFPPGWRYTAAFEVGGPDEDAAATTVGGVVGRGAQLERDVFRLEAAVLHCYNARRIHNRELVHATMDDLVVTIPAVARAMAIPLSVKLDPVYPEPRSGDSGGSGKGHERRGGPAATLLELRDVEAIDQFRVKGSRTVFGGLNLPPKKRGSGTVAVAAAAAGGAAAPTLQPARRGRTRKNAEANDATTPSEVAVASVDAFAADDDAVDELQASVSAPPGGASSTKKAPLNTKVSAAVVKALTGVDPVEANATTPASSKRRPRGANVVVGVTAPSVESHGPPPMTLRPYQVDAARSTMSQLEASRKALLLMACRTGKTPVALRILEHFVHARITPFGGVPGRVLLLVPSLQLLRQTAERVMKAGRFDGNTRVLLVGSGSSVTLKHDPDTTLHQTTDANEIARFFRHVAKEDGCAVVIATYHSAPELPLDSFALTVYDEAHRICTDGVASARYGAVTKASTNKTGGCRLYMTGTPDFTSQPLNMGDTGIFGGTAYRYPLRRGIVEGNVSDYEIVLLATDANPTDLPVGLDTPAVAGDEEEAADDAAFDRRKDAIVRCLVRAATDSARILVFCSTLHQAQTLADAMPSEVAVGESASTRVPVVSRTIGSHLPNKEVVTILRAFNATAAAKAPAEASSSSSSSLPPPRQILFNCRMIQEGVELAGLDAVFFASQRTNERDVVQAVCRPLTAHPEKPRARVYLPVPMCLTQSPTSPGNVASVVASASLTIDAMVREDSHLLSHIVAPNATKFALSVDYATRADRAVAEGAAGQQVGSGFPPLRTSVLSTLSARGPPSKAPRRLLHFSNLPWRDAFDELKRVVDTTGQYPVPGDTWIVGDVPVSLYRYFRYCQKRYVAALAKAASDGESITATSGGDGVVMAGSAAGLQPYQARDLESLPRWRELAERAEQAGSGPSAALLHLETLLQGSENGAVPCVPRLMAYDSAEATPHELVCAMLAAAVEPAPATMPTTTDGEGTGAEPQPTTAPDDDKRRARLCQRILGVVNANRPEGAAVVGSVDDFVEMCHAAAKAEQHASPHAWAAYLDRCFPGFPEKQETRPVPKAVLDLLAAQTASDASASAATDEGATGAAKSVTCHVCAKTMTPGSWASHVASGTPHQRRVLLLRTFLQRRNEPDYRFLSVINPASEPSVAAASTETPTATNFEGVGDRPGAIRRRQVVRVSAASDVFGNVRCTLCDVKCPDIAAFDDHVRGKTHATALKNLPNFLCQLCRVQCYSQDEFDLHCESSEHVAKERESFVRCGACDRDFDSGEAYAAHLDTREHRVAAARKQMSNFIAAHGNRAKSEGDQGAGGVSSPFVREEALRRFEEAQQAKIAAKSQSGSDTSSGSGSGRAAAEQGRASPGQRGKSQGSTHSNKSAAQARVLRRWS